MTSPPQEKPWLITLRGGKGRLLQGSRLLLRSSSPEQEQEPPFRASCRCRKGGSS
uniref:Uncharacterized protein n=1 Tax=Arundo donax TaxID=35708 RepID=A0A0A9FDB8_ARUDO